jgi:pyruvate/2-oxoglutarate dehydrogenase complex dihydrolipoamide acyltransferase (E2) component
MATDVLVPKIGFSMSEATLSEWLVADGAEVSEGQALCALESDKAVNELEAPASGTLRIVAEIGEVYEVGAKLAEIV